MDRLINSIKHEHECKNVMRSTGKPLIKFTAINHRNYLGVALEIHRHSPSQLLRVCLEVHRNSPSQLIRVCCRNSPQITVQFSQN